MKLIKEIESRIDKKGHKIKWGLFWCDACKQEVEKSMSDGKKCKACGCLFKNNPNALKHGGKGTKLYETWIGIKKRCLNPKASNFQYYGGRGITICPEWANDYVAFRDWSLSNGYQEGLEIDRRDNNDNYSPENCRWVTHKENCNNRRFLK